MIEKVLDYLFQELNCLLQENWRSAAIFFLLLPVLIIFMIWYPPNHENVPLSTGYPRATAPLNRTFPKPSPSQLPVLTPFAKDLTAFGGPYTYKVGNQKIINFGIFYKKIAYLSNREELTDDLLSESVKENTSNTYGEDFQRYNYVIDRNGEIYVAVWSKEVDFSEKKVFEPICSNQDISDTPGENQFEAGIMINYYPEDTFDLSSQVNISPCWIATPTQDGVQEIGILDGLSKHFLLSQDTDTSRDFVSSKWVPTVVAYAGEIVVNAKDCYYIVNNNSGTYQPLGGGYLLMVAEYFEDEIGIGPAYYQDTGKGIYEYKPTARITVCTP